MATDRIGTQIETLISKSKWEQAQAVIEKQLKKEPGDHWLWARLSGVKYEQRDYRGASKAAEKAREIVPDCPLAIWSYANAREMLGETKGAMRFYAQLFQRGFKQLQEPDEDADECWEGPDWTSGLVADCVFRIAGCWVKLGRREKGIGAYEFFLSLADWGIQGIHTHEDARARLKKLVRSKVGQLQAAVKVMEKEKELIPS
jgi:tetratricopeptide (TPR) repeat protein